MLDAIEHLEEGDLILLHETITDRLNRLLVDETRELMSRFAEGDAVSFENKQGDCVDAIVIRLNKKTVSLVSSEGKRWNVAPQLLTLTSNIQSQSETTSELTTEVAQLTGHTGVPASDGIEWVGGLISMPDLVVGEGPAYHPDLLIWLDEQGLIVGSQVFEPGEVKENVASSLRETIKNPKVDTAGPPGRLRVADKRVYDILKKAFTHMEVVLAPTPELDEFIGSMEQRLTNGIDEPLTYLKCGLPLPAIAAFFAAAAELYKAKPWEHVQNDVCLIGVSIESHSMRDAVLSILGLQGDRFGFILFDSIATYDAYTSSVDALTLGITDVIPGHSAINFVPGAELNQLKLKEIASNGWTVVNAQAYPDLLFAGSSGIRSPDVSDLDLIEGLCRALAIFFQQPERLQKVWTHRQPVSNVARVISYRGQLDIELSLPFPYDSAYAGVYEPGSVMLRLLQLGHGADFDEEKHALLANEVAAEFYGSAEGMPFENGYGMVDLIQQYAYLYRGETIATLLASGLQDILFDVIPRKVAIEPSAASDIIDSATAFYLFLKREYQLPQADACLALLAEDAESQLRLALADTSRFGMAKSLLSHAAASGFDTTSQEGIDAWLASTGGRVPDSIDLPFSQGWADDFGPEFPPAAKPVDKKARKKKRKAARKARKRKH